MVKAITFDLDGVYFTGESFKRFKKALPKRVGDEEKVNYVLYKSKEMLDFKMGKISETEYWDFVRVQLGVDVDNEKIFQILRESYEVNKEVQEYVKKVRSKGYKTCICTNNFVTRIRELNAKFGFLDDFDVVVVSCEVGVMKPEKEIFEALVEKSGLAPSEIAYSDDDESKLVGAKELGINAFVYTTFEDFTKKLTELGVLV